MNGRWSGSFKLDQLDTLNLLLYFSAYRRTKWFVETNGVIKKDKSGNGWIGVYEPVFYFRIVSRRDGRSNA